MKQYNTYIKEWWIYCRRKNINIYTASSLYILEFLTSKFNEGLSYSSLNCARSAINILYTGTTSNCPFINRFFKGIFNLKPPKPKYNETWDIEQILEFIEKLGPTESLTFEDLTQKTVALLALSTGHRFQTFANIKIDNICILQSEIRIQIPDRIKTTRLGSVQPVLTLPFLLDKPIFCVAKTLVTYISYTEKLRGNDKSLFIGIRKPHAKVSAQTISRWITSILTKAGINTTVFSAYSIRHATTSAALARGVDLDTIKKTAGWSTKSLMFAKFYNRPIVSNNKTFAVSVLTTK